MLGVCARVAGCARGHGGRCDEPGSGSCGTVQSAWIYLVGLRYGVFEAIAPCTGLPHQCTEGGVCDVTRLYGGGASALWRVAWLKKLGGTWACTIGFFPPRANSFGHVCWLRCRVVGRMTLPTKKRSAKGLLLHTKCILSSTGTGTNFIQTPQGCDLS